MKLLITEVKPIDFGVFRCVAKNSLGETDGSIRIYGKFVLIVYHRWSRKIRRIKEITEPSAFLRVVKHVNEIRTDI